MDWGVSNGMGNQTWNGEPIMGWGANSGMGSQKWNGEPEVEWEPKAERGLFVFGDFLTSYLIK